MFKIFICEDDQRQRSQLAKEIEKCIFMEDFEAEIAMVTEKPQNILTYLQDNPKTSGLYFLDIDLGCEKTGIDLAVEIRTLDTTSKIVFITTHGEMMHLTFFHHLEAMDYIVKGLDFEDVIRRATLCLKEAYERYLTENALPNQHALFKVKIAGKVHVYQMNDIMYFTSVGSRKLALHLKDGEIEFSGFMKDVEDKSRHFIRVHTSFLVNILNIDYIDKKEREIVMINGEKCFVSVRGLRLLERAMNDFER